MKSRHNQIYAQMKKMFILAAIAAAMMVAMPAQAQTRKDKKAAEKEQWELQQQQQREEAELRHKLRMDSIANAQKVAEQKAAKEEAERRAKEAEEKAKQKKLEEEAALQEVAVEEPCSEMEYPSTESVIRGHGIGVDRNQQFSIEKAKGYAINDLASQISSKVESLFRLENQSWDQNETNNFAAQTKQEIEIAVKQTTGYNVACRKTMTYTQNGVRMMKTYMTIEVSAEKVLKAAYDVLQQNNQTKIEQSFEDFHKDFKEHFQEL